MLDLIKCLFVYEATNSYLIIYFSEGPYVYIKLYSLVEIKTTLDQGSLNSLMKLKMFGAWSQIVGEHSWQPSTAVIVLGFCGKP